MITWENYEEYMMLDADGELDAADRQALQDFIRANPVPEEEYAIFNTLKLQPDTSIVFNNKQALLKPSPKGTVISLKPIALAAAAATIGIVIAISALWPEQQHSSRFVHTFPRTVSDAVPVRPIDTSITITPHRFIAPVTLIAAVKPARINKQAPAAATKAPARSDAFAILPSAVTASIKEAVGAHAEPEQKQEAVVAIVAKEEENQKSGLPDIHLATGNQPAVNLLKQALSIRVAQVTSVAKSIKETALTIKLGKGSVNINL